MPEEKVLTTWERVTFAISTNRVAIGGTLTALFAFLRVVLEFRGEDELFALLTRLLDLALIASVGTAAAGQFKSDDYHEGKKQELIRERTDGRGVIFEMPGTRRGADDPGTTQDMPATKKDE